MHNSESALSRASGSNATFDVAFYRATYPDVRLAKMTDAQLEQHWINYGRHETASGKRGVSPDFDESRYLASRPDVLEAIQRGIFTSGYDHWLRYGRAESGPSGPNNCLTRRSLPSPSILSDEEIAQWDSNGYLVLNGVISAERCDAVTARIKSLWADRVAAAPVSIDISLHNEAAKRIRFSEANDEDQYTPYKLNDLFLFENAVQELALDQKVCSVLNWILDDEATCCGSLNFERGSTQVFHQDTLYMPGKTTGEWQLLGLR
ncbi:phytanoyl-CoA dioxygenase family protein [Novacetimonas pomaceti]|uniref:phytanoyl-CoA dioxygenase family protein n=1 Tax=Novacetimonas pomaceti TaxID=2021998 RepID=UPI001C2D38EF|nr:phytanoyl-CoA dioxygenase family protein [Novacetimonas pomaceti]MBV1835424.1 phytanoyl-CoA dioxygenase family protein [Novacetimonas pomaceti]